MVSCSRTKNEILTGKKTTMCIFNLPKNNLNINYGFSICEFESLLLLELWLCHQQLWIWKPSATRTLVMPPSNFLITETFSIHGMASSNIAKNLFWTCSLFCIFLKFPKYIPKSNTLLCTALFFQYFPFIAYNNNEVNQFKISSKLIITWENFCYRRKLPYKKIKLFISP